MSVPMVGFETQVPQDIYLTLQAAGVFKDKLAERSRQLLAVEFYRDRVLSLGKAARLAGLTRWDFIDLLAVRDVPVIDYTPEEMAAELEAVERLAADLKP